ncbi:MAG TPA: hypothetical protein VFS43_14750 [Polyangiaceae bacterium]|nr:hypothetical protein [Polyangiaceae bacterium]
MEVLFEIWPFNIESGPAFLFFFAALWAASMLVATLLGDNFAARHEAGEAPGIEDEQAPVPAGSDAAPYRARAAADPRARRLRIGSPPREGDAWVIAYLRAGREGLVEALSFAAVAAGWVYKWGDKKGQPTEPVADPLLSDLRARLDGVTQSFEVVHAKAIKTAAKHEPAIVRRIEHAGLARAPYVRRTLGALVVGAGFFDVAVGLVRCVRAEALGRPHGFLFLEMITGLALAAVYASRRAEQGRSLRADRYLAWLEGATTSLRRDVLAGRAVSPEESANAVAIAGAVPLVAAPLFVAALPAAVLARVQAGQVASLGSASSLSSGTSTGSGSGGCSSGSSCGGGGCGGGGCGGGCGG